MIFFTCEDVIDVDLQNETPRLVIDASLDWVKGTAGDQQIIKLSLSAPFYSDTIIPANGATVMVKDSNDNIFSFIEETDTGLYVNNSFIPAINETYNLSIVYNNETYLATETMLPVSNIDYVEQKNDGGFSGEEIEIKAFYKDPQGIENFYLFEYFNTSHGTLSLEVYDDEFTDGNEIFGFHTDENLEAGNIMNIRSYGISSRNYEFMNILLQQTDNENGDPFEAQPVAVRGNCINQTNPDNFPYGYFRTSEVSEFLYTVE